MTWDEEYREAVRRRARELGSDGCSFGTGLWRDCCYFHDILYRTHRMLDGAPLTRRQADAEFFRCMQVHSPLGAWSPSAWGRWMMVRVAGRRAWRQKTGSPRRGSVAP